MGDWWSMTNAQRKQPKPPARGAAPVKPGAPSPFQAYLDHHRKVALSVLRELNSKPLSSLFTSAVIGAALVFPVLLVIALSNLYSINYDWKGAAQISLFMKQGLPELDATRVADEIRRRPNIETVKFISNKQALEDLKNRYDFGHIVGSLDQNPLPHVILVTPAVAVIDLEQLKATARQLQQIPEVAEAHLDAVWVERLRNVVQLLERVLWTVSLLFGISVLVIIGNTIRLAIESRREEIIVVKLVGGTDAFVCRPFLYLGSMLGMAGGVLAVIVVQSVVVFLSKPVEALVLSYQGEFGLSGLGFLATLLVLIAGAALGWLGAWLAVRRHLRDTEPV